MPVGLVWGCRVGFGGLWPVEPDRGNRVDSVVPELPGICGGLPRNGPGRGSNGSLEGSVDPGRVYPTRDQSKPAGVADGKKDHFMPMGLKLGNYDGTTSLEAFLTRFDTWTEYCGWDEKDRIFQLSYLSSRGLRRKHTLE